MPLHLSFDGGGSKLAAVVYDDDYNIIAFRAAGGTNARFLGAERVARNCEEALGGALDAAYAARGKYPADAAGVAVGPSAPLKSAISARAPDCAVTFIGEAYACRLAGALDDDGCVVIAGTGSGAAWVRHGGEVVHLGGYGPELGDEGGGYWIGQRGLRAAIAAISGWGEPTALDDALLRYLVVSATAEDAVGRVEALTRGLYATFYNDADPVPRHARIAGFAPNVGRACDSGDRVAAAIIAEAGALLARQAAALYRIYDIERNKSLVLSGGAWRSTDALGRAFRKELAALDGGFCATPVADALLPPFAAGAVWRALRFGTLEVDRDRIILAFARLQDAERK